MPNVFEVLQSKASGCDRCHSEGLLYAEGADRAYPLFQKSPPWPVRVVVVGEAPNHADTFDPSKRRLTLEPGTDPTGSFMFELLASVDLGSQDVLFTNSVLCLPARSGEGKHPVTARQQDLCAGWFGSLIDAANPSVVVTFGAAALQGLGRLERHGLTLREDAGQLHAWRDRALLPLYHPGRLGRVARPEAQQRADIAILAQRLSEERRISMEQAREILSAFPGGARVVVRSPSGETYQDLACSIGLRPGPSPVLAWLAPRVGGPPFWAEASLQVEHLWRSGNIWVAGGRTEHGPRQAEIHSLLAEERAQLEAWIDSLPTGVIEDAEHAMRTLLDPRSL